jgi:transposase
MRRMHSNARETFFPGHWCPTESTVTDLRLSTTGVRECRANSSPDADSVRDVRIAGTSLFTRFGLCQDRNSELPARFPSKSSPTSALFLHTGQRAHAAGIDIGATSFYVAVPIDRDPQPVRSFQTFTEDLHRLADWLQRCRIKTVAMESAGVFWVPLFQILEQRGVEVCLVNAHHVKNVPGRKTDVSDCQWLQYLHSVGLLYASFRPAQQVCALRSLLRHRDSLVQTASTYAQRMQKALDQMNLQLHHVISDLTGVSGVAILEGILNGERDPHKLAGLRDYRIKAREETVAKSLVGDYRREHLFTLRQSLDAWRYHRKLIIDCDDEVQRHLAQFASKADPKEKPRPRARKVSSSKVVRCRASMPSGLRSSRRRRSR